MYIELHIIVDDVLPVFSNDKCDFKRSITTLFMQVSSLL